MVTLGLVLLRQEANSSSSHQVAQFCQESPLECVSQRRCWKSITSPANERNVSGAAGCATSPCNAPCDSYTREILAATARRPLMVSIPYHSGTLPYLQGADLLFKPALDK